jgi:hypothetical protein
MVMAESEETAAKRPSTDGGAAAAPSQQQAASRRLTVWCKSLVFRGDGYAVFDDADGRMVFRVDNYGVGQGGDMALMDHAGRVLLTVRRRPRKVSRSIPLYIFFLAITYALISIGFMHKLNPFDNCRC